MAYQLKPCRRCGAQRAEKALTRVLCQSCFEATPATQSRAVQLVGYAVRKGQLPSLKENEVRCVDCGDRAVHYEHRDYSRPLSVEPVCASCNRLRGPALRPDIFGEAPAARAEAA